MYTSEELNLKLLSELRKICIEIGIKDVRTASKIELIEKILENQSSASLFNTSKSIATDSIENPTIEQPLFKEDKGLKNRKRLPKTDEKPAEQPVIEVIPPVIEILPIEEKNQAKLDSFRKTDIKKSLEKQKPVPAQPETFSDMQATDEEPILNLEEPVDFDLAAIDAEMSEFARLTEDIIPEIPEPKEDKRYVDTYTKDIKKQFNNLIKEFDGIIENEGVLEIMQE